MAQRNGGFTGWRGGVRGGVLGAMVSLAILAGVVPAAAGQDPGIRVGYYGGADADDPVPVIGLYGRLDIPGPLNLELSADYRMEQVHAGDIEATVIPVRVSAVLNLLPGVSPYLLAGVGADIASLSFHNGFTGTADEDAILYEAHAGAGIELGLGPLNFVADARYVMATTLGADAVKGVLGHDYDPSGWYISIAAGISF